jgi:ABC-2 type transport system ATP-binding protein
MTGIYQSTYLLRGKKHLESVVEVKELTRNYGKVMALNKLSFNIYKGEIFGIVGPNGAGKSTFISIMTSLLKPSYGDVYINGFSALKQHNKIKKYIGYVPQDIALYPMLSGMDNLNFWAGVYGLKGQLKKARIQEVLSVTRLSDVARLKVDNYSGGMKRRLNIAVAMLHMPEILVMDEPTVGVDILSRKYILDAVKGVKAQGKTVIFTSHYIDEMESICDRLAVLDKGVLKAIGTVRELQTLYKVEKIEDILLGLMTSDSTS